MNAHTHKATAGPPPVVNASRGVSVACNPGTHSSAHPCQDEPGAATSPAAQVAGAFPKRGGYRHATPITYNGITYPSQAAMSRALGINTRTISSAIHRNGLATLGAGKRAGLANAIAARRQPVAAHGWEWPSQTEAAKALGIGDSALCDMLRRGTFARNVLKRLGVKP